MVCICLYPLNSVHCQLDLFPEEYTYKSKDECIGNYFDYIDNVTTIKEKRNLSRASLINYQWWSQESERLTRSIRLIYRIFYLITSIIQFNSMKDTIPWKKRNLKLRRLKYLNTWKDVSLIMSVFQGSHDGNQSNHRSLWLRDNSSALRPSP